MTADVENRVEDKNNYSEQFRQKLEDLFIQILLEDERTVPYTALRYKLIKNLREVQKDNTYVTDDYLGEVLGDLIKKGFVGISRTQRYYVDYLDWPELNGIRKTGIFKMNRESSTGLICECEKPYDKHNATHFVHSKNFIPNLKNNDFVEFVELDTSSKKSQQARKSRYIDVKILSIIPKAKFYGDMANKHEQLQEQKELVNQELIKGVLSDAKKNEDKENNDSQPQEILECLNHCNKCVEHKCSQNCHNCHDSEEKLQCESCQHESDCQNHEPLKTSDHHDDNNH